MRSIITAALTALLLWSAAPAVAGPDPPPEAHGKKVTISHDPYWLDLTIFVDGVIVHGAKGRCFYPRHGHRRCFIIRVRVR